MIKNELKTARNKRGDPQANNMETESEDNGTVLGFDSEGHAAILKDLKNLKKKIVEDAVGNEKTVNDIVNKYQNEKLLK